MQSTEEKHSTKSKFSFDKNIAENDSFSHISKTMEERGKKCRTANAATEKEIWKHSITKTNKEYYKNCLKM